jgi:uncharacterized protein with GYD domain
MPQFLLQLSYAPESIAAQMKNPQNRIEVVGKGLSDSVGAKILAGGFAFGEFDIALVVEAPDNVTAAAVSLALSAGGAVRNCRTTPLLSGEQWIAALTKAKSVNYRPAV